MSQSYRGPLNRFKGIDWDVREHEMKGDVGKRGRKKGEVATAGRSD
jgi:hypothetical protein